MLIFDMSFLVGFSRLLIWFLLFFFSNVGFLFSDEFKNFFSKYGKVVEHEIIRDHETRRSRGFGFIVFDDEQVVDNILANGNKIDMSGTQVSSVQWITKTSDTNIAFHCSPAIQDYTLVAFHCRMNHCLNLSQ